MLTVTPPLEIGSSPRLQRANGRSRIVFRRRGDKTRLERLYQEGSSKIRLPRRADTAAVEAVLINTAGGLTGGDIFSTEVMLREQAKAVISTQACERIYKSSGGAAEVSTRIDLAAGACLDWLPQETILFDDGQLARRLDVDLADHAEFLAVESIIFGRAAMGERVRSGSFHDRWRIRRNGRLLFADDLRLGGDIAHQLTLAPVLAGNAALATMLYAGSECERLLGPVRAAIGNAGGASAWNDKLVIRLAASGGFALRRVLIPVLSVLMADRPLPKGWHI